MCVCVGGGGGVVRLRLKEGRAEAEGVGRQFLHFLNFISFSLILVVVIGFGPNFNAFIAHLLNIDVHHTEA